ncbi:hypothetical protein KP509_17G002600 [Ceratopteris richardii]|uniref:Pentatricopeptide repeat-containing protein n=1 Tax=Ceratopteris richardii TaxID=49495 RepID=A0A8T2STL2_CERRI|nr:hypothetical protein KP509_17G002600 [Ceratopteris richardii]
MQVEGFSSTDVTLVSLLDACSNIEDIIHRNLLKDNSAIGSAVIDMYAKCGLVDKAKEVFDKLSARNVILWTTLIAGYVQQEFAKDALDCLEKMVLEGISPNNVTYACSLKACTILGATCKGGELHAQAARSSLFKQDTTLQRTLDAITCVEQMQVEGFSSTDVTLVSLLDACSNIEDIIHRNLLKDNSAIGSAVIDMYAKCGLVDKAKEVFDKLSARNVILWTTLIAGYVQQEFAKDALDCLEKMVLEGISPNNVTYACSLKACTILGATCKGGELHAQAARSSLFKQDTTLQRTLVRSHEVFNTLSARDLSSWNTLMAGYAHLGDSANVLQIFEKLKRDGLQPDLSSFSHLLSVCGITGMLHSAHMFLHSMDDDYSYVDNALVDMYGKCGVSRSLSRFFSTSR